MINALTSIKPKSNQCIHLLDGAILKAIPTAEQCYQVILVQDVTNVEIAGGTILGERNEHIGTTGEFGYGIWIADNTDSISISNLTIKDCWGDGIMIGNDGSEAGLPQNLTIENVTCDNNRRQGMSITQGNTITVVNSTFSDTNGTNPQAGIDIEPSGSGYVENVTISSSSFVNNKWAGIALIGSYGLYIKNVKISNCAFDNNYVELYTEGNVINSGYVV